MKLQGTHIAFLVVGVVVGYVLCEGLHQSRQPDQVGAPSPAPSVQTKPPTPSEAPPAPQTGKKPLVPTAPEKIPMTPTPAPEQKPVAPPEAVDASAVPIIWVESAKYDTGILPNNTTTVKYLKVANQGNGPLVIKSAKANCGCVSVKMADQTIAPKASTNLEITINPKKITGFESTKIVTVRSNDPDNPELKIEVTARIDPEFAVEPEIIDLGEVQKGNSMEGTAVLRQLGTEPIEVVDVKPWGLIEGLDLSFEKVPQEQWRQQDRPEYRIGAKLSPDVSPGQFLGRFKIQTTCQRLPQYSSRVKATVKAFYSFQPLSVTLHNSAALQKQSTTASVTITGDRPFELSDVKPSNPAIVVSSRAGDAPNTMVLDLSLAPEAQSGSYNERVSFEIKAGDQVYCDRVYARLLVRKMNAGADQVPPGVPLKPLPSRLPRFPRSANIPSANPGQPAAAPQGTPPSVDTGLPAAAPQERAPSAAEEGR